MSEVITIGLDIAKHVFHVHGADERGRTMFSKRISRGKLLDFFAAQPSCKVALEACGGAHHWARQLTQLGHEVRLIPPAYVKPFAKRQKNDAISEPSSSRKRCPLILQKQTSQKCESMSAKGHERTDAGPHGVASSSARRRSPPPASVSRLTRIHSTPVMPIGSSCPHNRRTNLSPHPRGRGVPVEPQVQSGSQSWR